MLSAGHFWENGSAAYSDFEVAEGERVLGVVSGRRSEPFAYHYDIQFVIGRLE